MKRLVLVVLAAAAAAAAEGAICGSDRRPCRRDEYCVQESFCSSCDPICSHLSHNFEPTVCAENCFDYIIRFYDQRNQTEMLQVVTATSTNALTIAVISLVILVLLLVLAITVLLGLWIKYRKLTANYSKSSMKKKKIESIKAVSMPEQDGSRKLRLEMPEPVAEPRDAAAVSMATAMTPLSTRHPAEDATLEYAAYDNPGMNTSTPSTTPKTTRTETTF